jgi:DNA-binding CsgD family transcriptional regulator
MIAARGAGLAVQDRSSTLSDHQVSRLVRRVTEHLGEEPETRTYRTERAAMRSVPGRIREIRVVAPEDARRAPESVAPAVILVVIAEEVRPRGTPDIDELRSRFGLTPRQAEVALLLSRRRSNKEIARELGVTRHTAHRHTEAVLRKLGIHTRKDVHGVLVSRGRPAPGRTRND